MVKTLAVASGKGGVGKTFFVSNLATVLAQSGAKVLAFDADLQLANLDLTLGVKPEHNLLHVVKGELSLAAVAYSVFPNLKLISGGSAVSQLMNAGPKRMGTFLDQLTIYKNEFDFVLFDLGAGVTTKITKFAEIADEVLLVATPDPASLTDAYATVKVIEKRSPEKLISMILNQVEANSEGEMAWRVVNGISERFLGRSVQFRGSIRTDKLARISIQTGKVLAQNFPSSVALTDIQQLANRLWIREQLQRAA